MGGAAEMKMELSESDREELVTILSGLLMADRKGSLDYFEWDSERVRYFVRLFDKPITRHRVDQIAAGAK